ncbi:MAG: DNA polymerase III subunit beta [Bacteroidetes bacterium]|nr:DNA polymerase III subunit beta [Bacteroidota bacterium]
MKFIVSSSLLLKNLSALSGVLSASNTLPILDDFLFELNDETLLITASDLETTMTVTVPTSKSEEPGAVTIPAKILLDTLKTFADIPVSFTIDKETLGVEISAGEGKYKLIGHSSDEFPQAPSLEDVTLLKIKSSLLLGAFNMTIFATGTDELRPVMSGVFCELTPDNITFVATDAHKLVRYRRNDATSETSVSFILPKKPLNQLRNILPGDDSEVRMDYNQTNVVFTFDNVKMMCRLIDGKYPNYEAVIPNENPNVLTIDRSSILNSIKRVAIFANQSTHQVRLKMSGKELILSSEDIDFYNEAKERLTCNYEGEDMEIGFNSRFIQEMLSNLNTEQVKIKMSAPNRAGLILPVDTKNKDEDILMLVMPVMLNQ